MAGNWLLDVLDGLYASIYCTCGGEACPKVRAAVQNRVDCSRASTALLAEKESYKHLLHENMECSRGTWFQ